MTSPKPMSDGRSAVGRSYAQIRQAPLQIVHIAGMFMRIWSIYALYFHLLQRESVIVYIFACLLSASIIFLMLQKPWKGRPLSNSQVIPSVINGGILALYFVFWTKGLKSCGPLIAILAEYAGAVLGVLSAVVYGRKVNIWKKIGGLFAMIVAFYFVSLGWTRGTQSPLYTIEAELEIAREKNLGIKKMLIPILAGIFSALRRVIARRVSLKNQLKRRLHAITVASAACFMFPLAIWDIIMGSGNDAFNIHFLSWPYLSMVTFGIIFIFYIDNMAEERLHLVFSSPRHLVIASGCVIMLEMMHKMDFSLIGFLICSSILGFGIMEATSLERLKRDTVPQHVSDAVFQNEPEGSTLPL